MNTKRTSTREPRAPSPAPTASRVKWRAILTLACIAGLTGLGSCTTEQAVHYVYLPVPQPLQDPQGIPPPTSFIPAQPITTSSQVTLGSAQLDQLLAPIALYPDPLLSLLFPAATYPQDVIAANQWLAANSNPTEAAVQSQPWDDSIKGLVHYPDLLRWMVDQGDWTQTVGAAFLSQQQDVLNSIQRLRAHAQAARNLQTTPQEQVIIDDSAIRIEPANPEVIYVPQYDPIAVYAAPCPIYFGAAFPIGLWCNNDFDWHHHQVIVGGGWYHGWHHPADWDRHPPTWDHHPAGPNTTPRPWVRPQKPAPQLTPDSINHLALNRSREVTTTPPNPPRPPHPVPPAALHPLPAPIGKQPSKNIPDSPINHLGNSAPRGNPTIPAADHASPVAPPTIVTKPPITPPAPAPHPTPITPIPRPPETPHNITPAQPARPPTVSPPSPARNAPPAAPRIAPTPVAPTPRAVTPPPAPPAPAGPRITTPLPSPVPPSANINRPTNDNNPGTDVNSHGPLIGGIPPAHR